MMLPHTVIENMTQHAFHVLSTVIISLTASLVVLEMPLYFLDFFGKQWKHSSETSFDSQIQSHSNNSFLSLSLPAPVIQPLSCHCKHMLLLVSPVGWCWCWSLECLGSCPVATLCWRQNDHRERWAQDRAKSPPGLGPHTQHWWYRSYSETQNRGYVNYLSIACADLLCLCEKLHSNSGTLEVLRNSAVSEMMGNPKMPCHLRSVICLTLLYEWIDGPQSLCCRDMDWKCTVYSRLHVLGMTSMHSCSSSYLHL